MTRFNTFLTIILCAFITTPAFAEKQNIDSSFPSPFGSYRQLRLVPRATLPEPCKIGTLYYETGTELRFCIDPQDGTTNGVWGEINGVWTQIGDRIFLSGDSSSQANVKVGIGTTSATTPLMKLQIENGGILSYGQFGQGDLLSSSPGDGPRFLWYPRKAAVRIGNNSGANWDDGNIGDYSSITGGSSNRASGSYSIIQGGASNTVTGAHSVIAGGGSNTVSGQHSTIGGGTLNNISANFAAIGGGTFNTVQSDYGTISGGNANTIWAASEYSAILGGLRNAITGQYSTISGGNNNVITVNGASYTTIAAGQSNSITGQYSTVLATSSFISGQYATLTGGSGNNASGAYSSIPGGVNHQASGMYSVNLHPSLQQTNFSNSSGNYSINASKDSINSAEHTFLIGKNLQLSATSREALIFARASALTISSPPQGSFVLLDHSALANTTPMRLGIGVNPNAGNQFEIYNGAYINNAGHVCNNPLLNPLNQCLTPPASDRRLKKKIEQITGALETLSKMQGVTFQWNEQSASDTEQHTGFIAQEIETIFPQWVSTDSKGYKYIDLRETDALLAEAVKELYFKSQTALSNHAEKIRGINRQITVTLEKQRALLAEQSAIILQQEAELSRLKAQRAGKLK